MNISTSARATARRHKPPTDTIEHTTDALASRIHPTSAANDDARAVDESMVNPLWMITVGLAVFFGLSALLLASF
jgi:hypothetical protein